MEMNLLYFLQKLHTPALDKLMLGASALGNAGIFWILCTLLLLCLPKYRKSALAMAAALFLSALICNIFLKNLVARPRPCWIDPSVSLLLPIPKDFSFPSGHTSASFAAAGALWAKHRYLGSAALLVAGLIGFSRLYLFVHYPTDVLSGCIIGIFCAFLGVSLVKRIREKAARRT